MKKLTKMSDAELVKYAQKLDVSITEAGCESGLMNRSLLIERIEKKLANRLKLLLFILAMLVTVWVAIAF